SPHARRDGRLGHLHGPGFPCGELVPSCSPSRVGPGESRNRPAGALPVPDPEVVRAIAEDVAVTRVTVSKGTFTDGGAKRGCGYGGLRRGWIGRLNGVESRGRGIG